MSQIAKPPVTATVNHRRLGEILEIIDPTINGPRASAVIPFAEELGPD
jgi:hypothetical protein